MAAKETFLAACDALGWTIADDSPALGDLAEHLFDHAGRGSDPWSLVMTRVRDAAREAAVGADIAIVKSFLIEAADRATARGIALPGAS